MPSVRCRSLAAPVPARVDAVDSRGAHSDAGRSGVADAGGNGPGAGSAVEDSPDARAVGAPAQPEATEVADAPDRPTDADADTCADADVPGPPAPDGWFQPSGDLSRLGRAVFASSAPEPDAPPPIAGPWEPPSGSSNGNWATPPLDGGPDPTAAPPGPEGADGLIDAVSWGAGPGAPAAPLPQRKPALVVAPPPASGAEEDGLTAERADPVPPVAAGPGRPGRPGPDLPGRARQPAERGGLPPLRRGAAAGPGHRPPAGPRRAPPVDRRRARPRPGRCPRAQSPRRRHRRQRRGRDRTWSGSRARTV